jgi:hypothetical protein
MPNILTREDLTDSLPAADALVRGDLHTTGPGGLDARASGEVASARDLLSKADLCWTPEFRTLTTDRADVTEALGLRAVVRSDTGAALGVVGDKYRIFTHEPMADLADAIVGASGGALRLGNAGHKRGGALPFVQLAMMASSAVGDHETKITIFSSHDGSLRFTAGMSRTLIVCANTYAHALGDCRGQIQIRHTASGAERLAMVQQIAQASCAYGAAWDASALRMLGTRMTDQQMHALACHLYPGETGRAKGARERLETAWTDAPGAAPGTAWGAAQAVTFYTSHHVGSSESREITALTGMGTGADVQAAAWWALDVEPEVMAQRLQTVTLWQN